MQFKKNRAILAAVVAAAMATSALMSVTASAHEAVAKKPAVGTTGDRTKEEKYGTDTYADRFMSMYDDVITHGDENGYLSKTNKGAGGFGVPYHSVEELICEAPDYGHETTSEAMSYIVWVAAMHDNLANKPENKGKYGSTGDLAKAWSTLEALIPEKTQQKGFAAKSTSGELSAQVADEHPHNIGDYPSEGNQSNVGKNPIGKELMSAYSEGREYLLHWLADVDDWYGFGGSAQGTAGKLTFINTFQRGDQESCFETIPHPSIETLTYGNPNQGMKFAFQQSTAKSWSYTNAPDAEDRAIQAVYAANRWKVGDSTVSSKAGMMGDFCRNDMFDKYYKTIGCQSKQMDSDGGGTQGQHFLMSWYTAWGGAEEGTWAWQIGCSHSHQFYQNPLAAYGLLYDSGLSSAMKAQNARKDYVTSLGRQMELYLWLQSKNGPFAGGCTNSWNGKYEKYPSGWSTFHDMAYIEHPVYADPGSNHWTGNQFWATQRLAELYYIIKTEGDKSTADNIKPGGMSLEKALETVLDRWVEFFVTNTKFDDKGDFSVPASLDWEGQPASWNGTYKADANNGLTCTITASGNSDFGCAASLADTLVYYAKAKGVEPTGSAAAEGTKLEEKALYTAQQLMDRLWAIGRDNIGVSRTDHNGSLARFFEQEVYIPVGNSGKYPYGYTVSNGAKFIDLRPMYEDVEGFADLKAAWEADVANGATYDNTTSDCSAFTNVAAVDLKYHRFWHAGDVLMTLGTLYELYPQLKPTTSEVQEDETDWGNVDCSEGATVRKRVNIADAVLLAQYNAEISGTKISAQGLLNAQCCWDENLNGDDTTYILEFLAGLKDYSELGNPDAPHSEN
jgi:hypothetical protein